MRKHLIFAAYFASLFLASCIHKVDVDQGNIITQEMIDQLEPHMNKRQVRFIMGTPLLIDVFHQQRWDYIYSVQPGGEPRSQKQLSLFFDDEKLVGVQGDYRPAAVPVLEDSKDTTVIVPKRDLDNTLWGKIKGLFDWED